MISPGWASLETATPLNGARMTVSSRAVRRTSNSRSATTTSLALVGDPRLERVRLGPRRVESRLCDQALVQQPALAIQVEACLLVAHFEFRPERPRTATS